MIKKYHVKKDDSVTVTTGKWKNRKAKVIAVLRKNDRVVIEVEGATPEMLGKRSVKKTQKSPGGLVERAASVHVSNLKLNK